MLDFKNLLLKIKELNKTQNKLKKVQEPISNQPD